MIRLKSTFIGIGAGLARYIQGWGRSADQDFSLFSGTEKDSCYYSHKRILLACWTILCQVRTMAPGSIDPEPLPWQSTVQRKKQQQNDILSKALLELENDTKLQDVDIDKLANATQTLSLISKGQLTCKTVVQGLVQRCAIDAGISLVTNI
jgi:hypothetical protein